MKAKLNGNNSPKKMPVFRSEKNTQKPLQKKVFKRHSNIKNNDVEFVSHYESKGRLVTKKVFAEIVETKFNELSIRLFGRGL